MEGDSDEQVIGITYDSEGEQAVVGMKLDHWKEVYSTQILQLNKSVLINDEMCYLPARAGSRNCLNATFRVPRGVLVFPPFEFDARRSPGAPKFDAGICCTTVGDDDSK